MNTQNSSDHATAEAFVKLQHIFDNMYIESLHRPGGKHAKPENELTRMRDTVAVRAAFNGNVELLAKLLRLGADPNLTGPVGEPHGLSILHMAVARKDYAMTELLLNSGADYNRAVTAENYRGITPLHVAVSKNAPNLVALLLNCNGIQVNAALPNGETPLLAVLTRLSETRTDSDLTLARLLLKKGAILPDTLSLQDAKVRSVFEAFVHDPRLMLTALAYAPGDTTPLIDRYRGLTSYFRVSSDFYFQKTVLEILTDAGAGRYFDAVTQRGVAGIAAEHADYAKNVLGFVYQFFGGSVIAIHELRRLSAMYLKRKGRMVPDPGNFKGSALLQQFNVIEIGLL